MRKPLLYGFAIVALVLSVALVVWQGSFSPWQFGPSDPYQTFIFWAISSLIFVLMVTLGFILFREGVKLYVERQSNREGSRIKTKLVVGALTLSFLPVFFLVLFSYEVLNHSLEAWFRKPADNEVQLFVEASVLLQREIQDKVNTQAALLAAQPETRQLLADGVRTPGFLERFSKSQGLVSAAILPASGDVPLDASGPYTARPDGLAVVARSPVADGGKTIGYVALASRLPLDVARQTAAIEKYNQQWSEIRQVQQEFQAVLRDADGRDHALRAVRGNLDRAVPVQADQHSHHRAAGCRPRSAQRQPQAPRPGARHRRAGFAGARLQPDDAGTGDQQPGTRPAPPLHRGHSRKHPHGRHLDWRRRLHPAREPGALQDLPGRTGGPRHAPGGSVLARGHGRNQVPHEARAAHRRGFAPARAAHREPQAASGHHGFGARREAHLGVRGGAGRHQRAAARAEGRRLARGGPPRGPRNQEPAHAHRAFGRAHRAAAGPPRSAARRRAHRARMRRHYLEIGGIGEDAGGRILAVRALPLGPARAFRSERGGGRRAGGFPGAPGRHFHRNQLRRRGCRR